MAATRSIDLKTSIPGPRSQELMRRRTAAVPHGAYHVTPIFVARSEGAVLEDVDAQNTLVQARDAYDDGQVRYRVAIANLKTLTGNF